jgi:MFS superfamily sulfate permease-like transporter
MMEMLSLSGYVLGMFCLDCYRVYRQQEPVRTAKNIRNSARTPIAASLHAVFILIYVLLLTPVLAYTPMAALAALLVRVAFHMSYYQEFIQIIRTEAKQ